MVSKDGFTFHRDEKGNKTGLFGKEWQLHCAWQEAAFKVLDFNGVFLSVIFVPYLIQ